MTRYRQFCALARAAEFLGERWTLLIVRELLLGPKRFADLLKSLPGISPAVLAQRLRHIERAGLARRSFLPPPAAVSVYELTEDGSALRPGVLELIAWGGRFLLPARRGDAFEPEWISLMLEASARRRPTPSRSFVLRTQRGRKAASVRVVGGRRGTRVSRELGRVDATLTASVETMLALVGGTLRVDAAVAQGLAEVTGDEATLRDLPLLFHLSERAKVERRRSGGSGLHRSRLTSNGISRTRS